MLNEIKEVFTNYTKAFEVLYVIEGIKPVARMALHEWQIPKAEELLKKYGVFLEKSGYKVRMDFEGSYSTKGKKIKADSEEKGHFFVYISKSKKNAEDAKFFEEMQAIRKFGRLLGYPECCIDFFIKNKRQEEKKSNDYVMPALKGSKGYVFPFYNNVIGRYFDIALLSHCPCSFNCKSSLNIAKKHLNAIEKHDKRVAGHITNLLKSLAIYSEEQGIFLLKGRHYKDEYSYEKMMKTKTSPLYQLLKANKSLSVVNNSKIMVGSDFIEDIKVAVFV